MGVGTSSLWAQAGPVERAGARASASQFMKPCEKTTGWPAAEQTVHRCMHQSAKAAQPANHHPFPLLTVLFLLSTHRACRPRCSAFHHPSHQSANDAAASSRRQNRVQYFIRYYQLLESGVCEH